MPLPKRSSVFNSVEALSKTLIQPSTLVECDASEDSKIENAMKLKLRKVSRMKNELVLFYKI